MAETGWAEMESISQNIQILPADTLTRICRGPLVKFTLECQDNQKVKTLWQSLFQTFADASTSASHTTTTCNAVSGFLDAALLSKNHETQEIALSKETWLSVFEVYVDRFEDAKPKPMKQVLNSLLKILAKYTDSGEVEALLSRAGEIILPSIITGEPRSRLKVSLLSLEIFVRKNAISPYQLMNMVSNFLSTHGDLWKPVFEQHHETWISGSVMNGEVSGEQYSITHVARIFTLALLIRATSPEIASASGAVLASLLQKIKAALPSSENIYLDPTNSLPIWVAPTKQIMQRNMDALDTMSNHMLTPLFTVDSSGFRTFIDQLPVQILLSGDMTEAPLDQFTLLFSALQIGKKVGLVHEDGVFGKASTAKNNNDAILVIKSDTLGQFLLHREGSIRVAALSLLITASSTTKPIGSDALQAILFGLPALHADSDAQSRGHILTLTRRLLVRLRSGTQKSDNHAKGAALPEVDENPRRLKRRRSVNQSTYVEEIRFDSREFLERYVSFLERDLEPTASYQRHIMALKALALVLQSRLDSRVNAPPIMKSEKDVLPWRFSLDILRPRLLRLLVDLLLDPFEEVRATSLSILAMFPLESSQIALAHDKESPMLQLIEALTKAEHLASSTSRADHADAVARLYHVVFSLAAVGSDASSPYWYRSKYGVVNFILKKLEGKLLHPGGLFNSSMRDAPLHGYISALRYIVATSNFYSEVSGTEDKEYTSWKAVHDSIVSFCDRIWMAVKPVLCVDSPEGHTDEPIEDLVVGPKDILSYSWRALRESSLLLHATLANSSYAPSQGGLSRTDYETIGMASFTQLAELRHRGAFSTVSQTFSTCCQRCGESSDPSISSLPAGWYMQARNIIEEQASKLTRRSAGLPALVTGILSSNPGGPLFQQVMTELQDISRLPATQDATSYEIKLPQVHAMNCLKDIFTDTRLGPHTEPFIMSALRISAECISSQIWAIRNCGLMLFRALLIRMCRSVTGVGLGFGGVSGSESGSRIPFQRYPGLINLLSGLLTPEGEGSDGKATTATERVFPALELIGEKVPSISGDEDRGLRSLVLYHAKSPVWAIREHASRVYASLLKLPEVPSELGILLESNESSGQNYIHGKALCIRFALQRLELSLLGHWNDQLEAIMRIISKVFTTMFPLAHSPFVQAAILDILNDAIEKSMESGSEVMTLSYINSMFETNDLSSRLDRALVVAHPSMEPKSEARASSLLRRSLAWTSILKQSSSVKSEPHWLSQLLFRISAVDPDSARWLLEQMSRVFGNNATYKKQLLDLCTYAITESFPEYVKACAITTMAAILEGLLETDSSSISDFEVPWTAIRDSIQIDYDAHTQSRETTDAALRLQGCLLILEARSLGGWELSRDFTLGLRKWAIKVQYAMKEETEFTTRYAAVLSLSSFSRALRSQTGSPKTPPAALDIYLILYDMLNDDDEELREISASVASQLLSYSSVSPGRAVALAPLTASKLLAEFIAAHYKNSHRLFRDAVRRVVGQAIGTSQGRLVAVSQLASEYLKESTVLFVEEKQNLYIDDIREINIWTEVLFGLEADATDPAIVQDFSGWVMEGLSYLTQLACSSKDGLLGWASKTDMFVLGTRVLSAARFLVSQSSAALGHREEDRLTLKQKVQSFLEAGRSANLHDDWLSKMESALASSAIVLFIAKNAFRHVVSLPPRLKSICLTALDKSRKDVSIPNYCDYTSFDWMFGSYSDSLLKKRDRTGQNEDPAIDATAHRLVVPDGTRRTEEGISRDFVASTAV
ncbi:hypothetical protein DTO169C6_7663 [Paecilomyces variotii]|nr:hypothetical protein DTO169C6_7663 [Paecilomyces variotii]KAJ9383860.1 hypothetical protein DTO063F5_4964 [Paecilomyces variotii]